MFIFGKTPLGPIEIDFKNQNIKRTSELIKKKVTYVYAKKYPIQMQYLWRDSQ